MWNGEGYRVRNKLGILIGRLYIAGVNQCLPTGIELSIPIIANK